MTRAAAGPPPAVPRKSVAFANAAEQGERFAIHGPGGVGKSTLAYTAPGPVAVFDLEDSMYLVRKQMPAETQAQLRRVAGIKTWQDIRTALNSDGWDEIKTVVIDSATRAEELATAFVVATIPHEKGHKVSKIEEYGFGKGYQYVYDVFLTLLGDLDAHARAGRHIVLICHECTATVPNPSGDDYLRFEPRLQSLGSGKASIRHRVKEWADHLLFFGFDVEVAGSSRQGKPGKGKGNGTRTVWPVEMAHCMAKSRTMSAPFAVELGRTTLAGLIAGGADGPR